MEKAIRIISTILVVSIVIVTFSFLIEGAPLFTTNLCPSIATKAVRISSESTSGTESYSMESAS